MTFLESYLTFAANNEAPRMFHVWASYACLSSAISRTVWLPWDNHAKFLNVYAVFVGGAGNGKTVAMDKARWLLTHLKNPAITITGNVETPEGFLRFIAGNPSATPPIASPVARPVKWPNGNVMDIHPVTIIANEFVNFISQNQEGWINQLTDIYDRDEYEYRTKNQGTDRIYGPYIVMLTALTTEMQQMLHSQHIISTGLARRAIFQYGERNVENPVPRPRVDEVEIAAMKSAIEHLQKVQTLSGEFQWGEGAVEWWDNWYVTHIQSVPTKEPQVQGWFWSKSDQVLKIAMLTAIGNRLELALRPDDFDFALMLLEEMEKDLMQVFGGAGRNELAMVGQRIVTFLASAGQPVSYDKVDHAFWAACRPPSDFTQTIDHLVSAGRIIKATMEVGGQSAIVLTTPAVLAKFRAKHPQLRVATQTVTPPASVVEERPSYEHVLTQSPVAVAARQLGVGTPGGKGNVAPPTVPPAGG